MHRIFANAHGEAYLSAGSYRLLPQERDSYSLVHEISQALDVLNECFQFEFPPIPFEQTLR